VRSRALVKKQLEDKVLGLIIEAVDREQEDGCNEEGFRAFRAAIPSDEIPVDIMIEGIPLIHYVAAGGTPAMLEYLVCCCGVDLIRRDSRGRLPVHQAEASENEANTQWLRKHMGMESATLASAKSPVGFLEFGKVGFRVSLAEIPSPRIEVVEKFEEGVDFSSVASAVYSCSTNSVHI